MIDERLLNDPDFLQEAVKILKRDITTLKAQLAKAEADGKRLDWLQRHVQVTSPQMNGKHGCHLRYHWRGASDLRQAIDKARAALEVE